MSRNLQRKIHNGSELLMHKDDIRTRIYAATVELLFTSGTRRLRSLEIAQRAKTTESTMFRYFASLEEVLALSLSWCWDGLVTYLATQNFEAPATDPRQKLDHEFTALWRMSEDEYFRILAAGAILFPYGTIPETGERSAGQARYEAHQLALCTAVRGGNHSQGRVLQLQLSAVARSFWHATQAADKDEAQLFTAEKTQDIVRALLAA